MRQIEILELDAAPLANSKVRKLLATSYLAENARVVALQPTATLESICKLFFGALVLRPDEQK